MKFGVRKLTPILFLLSGLAGGVFAQTFSYTKNALKFDVTIENPCDAGATNGSITFKVTGSASGVARIVFISGPTGTAFPDADISLSGTNSFTFVPGAPQNGNYEFLVRDPNTTADFVNTLTAEFDGVSLITLTPIVLGTANLVNNTDCTTANGQLAASLSGGSAALTPAGSGSFNYTWSSSSAVVGLPASGTWNGATNLDLATVIGASGLPGGTYTLLVQDNRSTCQQTKAYTITDPAPVSFNTATTTPVVCKGSTGTITLSGSGSSSVVYEIFLNGSATGNQQSGTGSALTFTIPGSTFASPGTYNFTIRAKDGFCPPGFMAGTATITVNADVTFTTTQTNPSCNGAPTGSITVTAAGGSTPYQYSSDNGTSFQASNQFTGLISGIYPIVVKDALGCLSTATSVTLTQPPAITFNATPTDPVCNGQSNGSISIAVTSAAGTYSYSINNGTNYQASSSFSGLAAGTYIAKVKDAAGCESAGQNITLVNPATVTFTTTKTDPLCSTGNTGSITFNASGGSGTYQYSINNGTSFSAASTASNLAAGSYTLVVRDSRSCLSATSVVTLTTPAAVTVSPAVTNETCPGNGNATIVLSGGGGTAPYTFSINGGSTFQASGTFTSVAAGTYQVQAKDANGCVSTTGTATVTAKTPISVATSKTNITSCSPGNDGAVTLTASGGTGPFTYSLDNGVTFGASGTFTGLTAGTYTGIAKDNLGCLSAPVTVTFAAPFTVTLTGTGTDLNCNGSADGSIALTATGGNGTYTYSKDNGVTFQAGSTFSSLAAGTYTLVAKDGANCQATTTVTITEPASTTVSTTGTNILCNGLSTGAIAVTAGGGNGGFTYSKDNGVTFQPASSFTALAAGTYSVKVKDSKGCTSAASVVTLTQPAALSLSVASTNVISCVPGSDGTITATGSGGTGALTYSINGTTFQASGNFTGVNAGTFTVTLKDANACTTTRPVTITSPPVPTFTFTKTDLLCNGGGTGSIAITASGGTAPLQYSKDNGVTFQAGSTFSTLAAGTYSLVIKDAGNCTATGTAIITEPTAIVPSVTNSVVTCNGGADGGLTITATGGTGAYQFSNDNGVTFQASGTFTGIAAGVYAIVVKDASGCTANTTSTVTEPAVLSVTATGTNILCNGLPTGAISANATGGNGGFTYSSDNGVTFQAAATFSALAAGTYTVKAKDNKGCISAAASVTITQPSALSLSATSTDVLTCVPGKDGTITATGSGGTGALTYSINGTSFQASGNFTGVDAGTFTVTLKDANACTNTTTVTLINPSSPTFTISKTDLTCNSDGSGSLNLTASGGTTPFQYSKDNGISFQPGAAFTSLSAGTYTLVVKDAANCTSTGTSTLSEPAAIIPSASVVSASCNGTSDGSIALTATGGTGAYQFSADNGTTFQATGTFAAKPAGAYNLVVKDASGCTATTASTITEPAILTVAATGTNILCNGATTGSINAIATGGNGGYNYSSDNGTTFQSSSTFSTLAAGSYSLQAKDSKGCISSVVSVTLTEPTALVLTASGTDVTSCTPGNDGTITASGSGGTGTYQFALDNRPFQSGGGFTGLSGGTYVVKVKDANACLSTSPVTILTPGGLTFTYTQQDLTCFEDGSGAITVTATGGNTPLQYSKDNGTTFQAGGGFTALAAGDYTLLVKDASSCTFTSVATIAQPGKVVPAITTTDITCNGLTDGQLSIAATGGDSNYQYSIDNGNTYQSSGDFSGLVAANYTIIVKDGKACQSAPSTAAVIEPSAINWTGVAANATCSNNDGTITISGLSGGTLPYVLEFNGAAIAALPSGGSFSALAAGAYPFKVTDKNSCVKTETFTITKPADIQASAVTTDPTCSGNGSDGKITITITSSGDFEAGISPDAGTPPATFLPVTSTGTGTLDFTGLSRNDHFITIRHTTLCTVTLTETISGGPSAVDVTVDGQGKLCFEDQATITLSDIKGDPTLSYTCEILDGASAIVLTRTITPAEALTNVVINTTLTGGLSLRLFQDQTATSGCASITSDLKPFLLDAPAAKLDTISTVRVQSQEIQATGSIDGVILPSGETPYETSLELITPAVAGQSFFEDFSEATVPTGAANPAFMYSSLYAGIYTLTLRDAFGCVKTYAITIDLDPELFVPNIFTPNGDQVNDTFYVRNLPANSGLIITNRWGKEIYTSVDYKNDWDAKGAGDGIYYYKLVLADKYLTGWVEVLSGR